MFRCDEKLLEDSLCKRVIVTRDETITKWLDPESAVLSRDALAKTVYSKLFDWYGSLLLSEYDISELTVLIIFVFFQSWTFFFETVGFLFKLSQDCGYNK